MLDRYLERLEELVNIDCGSNTPEGIKKVTEYFKDIYEGWIVEYHELNGKNPVLTVKNRDVDKFDFLFIGHNDTVFPVGTVEKRPYRVQGDIARGPGVIDMKSGLLSMYEIAKEFKDSPLNFCIIINSDEEISSLISRDLITELGKRAENALVFEPARKNGNLVKERKGLIKYEITFKGKASHAGVNPEDGVNAILEASNWVLEISKLHDLEKNNSINVGIISGGIGVNVVPDHCSFKFEGRSHSISHFEKIFETIERLKDNPIVKGIEVDVKEIGYRPPLVLNEASKRLVDIFQEEMDKLNIKCELERTGGGSDANFLGILGVGVVDGVGPIGGGAHTDDEYLEISSIEERISLVKNVLNSYLKNKRG